MAYILNNKVFWVSSITSFSKKNVTYCKSRSESNYANKKVNCNFVQKTISIKKRGSFLMNGILDTSCIFWKNKHKGAPSALLDDCIPWKVFSSPAAMFLNTIMSTAAKQITYLRVNYNGKDKNVWKLISEVLNNMVNVMWNLLQLRPLQKKYDRIYASLVKNKEDFQLSLYWIFQNYFWW